MILKTVIGKYNGVLIRVEQESRNPIILIKAEALSEQIKEEIKNLNKDGFIFEDYLLDKEIYNKLISNPKAIYPSRELKKK